MKWRISDSLSATSSQQRHPSLKVNNMQSASLSQSHIGGHVNSSHGQPQLCGFSDSIELGYSAGYVHKCLSLFFSFYDLICD
jgi:hypothetical protein